MSSNMQALFDEISNPPATGIAEPLRPHNACDTRSHRIHVSGPRGMQWRRFVVPDPNDPNGPNSFPGSHPFPKSNATAGPYTFPNSAPSSNTNPSPARAGDHRPDRRQRRHFRRRTDRHPGGRACG
jgi:hypothetical protein